MSDRIPLQVNDPLEVKLEEADHCSICESRVEQAAENELLIDWPTVNGERVPVREHEVLTILFSRQQAALEFEARVLDRIEDPIALLAIRPINQPRSIQRRNDFRVRVPAPVELVARVVRLSSYRNADTAGHHIRTETLTLSAGGFSFHHHSPLEPGTLFATKLLLPGERRPPLSLSARVVRCTPIGNPDAEPSVYEVGLAFVRISEAARTRIVRFVFSAQRAEKDEG